MILKPSVLLCSCLLFSFCIATPTPKLRRDVGDESPEESVKEFINEVGKSVKHLTENSQWIYKSLASIVRNTVLTGFQNVASYVVDFQARIELFTMADGSHFIFPLNGKSEIEQEYKTVAITVSKLLMNLKTMERTDEILKNVSKHLVVKDIEPHFQELKPSPEKMLRTFLHTYFETLDHQMEADKDLKAEYKEQKTAAREEVKRNPRMREAPVKIWEPNSRSTYMEKEKEMMKFLEDKKTLHQVAVNKLFMKHATKHFEMIFSAQHHQRYLLARALIQKARSASNSDSKINEVYHQALARVAELSTDKDDADISNALFNSIENTLQSHPTLEEEIHSTMKQIEGNTVYDSDMIYVDLSVL